MASQLVDYVVSYDALKAWIFDQEEYARRTGEPAPLTSEQLQAMAVLVPPPPPPPPAALAQGGGDLLETDYVSLLMRYVQAQARKGPTMPPEYINEVLPRSILGSPQWRTRCRLPREAPDQWFPDVNEPRPQDSVFPNTKASRRHAARCAVEWLIAQGHMSSNGEYVAPDVKTAVTLSVARTTPVKTVSAPAAPVARSPSPPLGRAARPLKRPFESPSSKENSKPPVFGQPVLTFESGSSSSAPPDTIMFEAQDGGQVTSSPRPIIQSMASWKGTSYANTGAWEPVMAAADNGISAINRVGNSSSRGSATSAQFRKDSQDYEGTTKAQLLDTMCKTLKLGSPSYKLTPVSEEAQGVFNGHIVFTPSGAKGGGVVPVLPEGVGEVRDVFTKKAAKERIAESVLLYLEGKVSDLVSAVEDVES